MQKAFSLYEIDPAVRFDTPVGPDHPFYVDFSGVRGNFEDQMVYRTLNIDSRTFSYNANLHKANKTLLFLGGMRGSGKTSEICKYVSRLENPNGFFCVTCNIDQELDLNDLEYMDILIFQLEKLFAKADKTGLTLRSDIIEAMHKWFIEQIREINTTLKREIGLELETGAETPGFFSLFKLAAALKMGVSGSKETATVIRRTFKNRFNYFADKFNEFVGEVTLQLRQSKKAQDLLFVVDGLEKTMSADVRRKIILEESNRIRQIKANTIFTLPIELMKERNKLGMFSTVTSFPFVKLIGRDGSVQAAAMIRFEEFVYKRVDRKLFDSEETVRKAIRFSGGSPRQLLRILEYCNIFADPAKGVIEAANLNKALERMANEDSGMLNTRDLELLQTLKKNNEEQRPTPFDEGWQELLENMIVFEYNDGSYKRVNPIIEISPLYQQYVK